MDRLRYRAAAFVFDGSGSVAEPGGIDHDYLSVMDVMPTLLEIAGTSHSGTEFQSQSVLPDDRSGRASAAIPHPFTARPTSFPG